MQACVLHKFLYSAKVVFERRQSLSFMPAAAFLARTLLRRACKGAGKASKQACTSSALASHVLHTSSPVHTVQLVRVWLLQQARVTQASFSSFGKPSPAVVPLPGAALASQALASQALARCSSPCKVQLQEIHLLQLHTTSSNN